MRDEDKTKTELINELVAMRQRIAALEAQVKEFHRLEREHQRVEEALRESEKKFRDLVDNALVGIYITQKHILKFCNRRLAETFGYQQAEELIGKHVKELVTPETWALVDTEVKLRESGQKGFSHYEFKGVKKDGTTFDIEALGVRITYAGKPAIQGTLIDVTEHKRAENELRESKHQLEETLAELKATQQQVLQQERLAAVGQLAAGIAHDFNNLLTSIIGFAELLQIDPAMPQAAQADLARIVKQGQRGAHLVRQILDFSRKSIRQPQPLDLVPFVKEVTRFLKRTFPENILILVELVDGTSPTPALELPVKADPTQLQQMLTNLALNAREAMPAGGELRLRLAQFSLEAGERPPCPEMPPGAWAVCSVSDTGIGIPAEILPRIFEPFFTTREVGQGTGLGLAQVYGIVQQHQGHLDVRSQLGQGTTITIYLPLQTVERAPSEAAPTEINTGDGQTVLLVEDKPEVLAVGQAMLEHLGYQVLVAADGQQALELYAAHQDQIALVLTDMVMPGMDGITLFHALKTKNPTVKVVIMTGYPLLDEAARESLAQGIVEWVQKPLALPQLAQVVSRALQSPGHKQSIGHLKIKELIGE